MVAKAVIQEFAADGVKYLELRSTRREVTETGLTKQRYTESVLEAIRQCKQEEVDVDVRFLVAMDRRHGPEVAMETVKLAEDFLLSSDGIVVGLDLSGDPTVGHGKDLLSALEKAKNCGLKLALHLSEVPSQRDESELLLNLPPDRIGHGTFLHPEVGGSDSLVDKVCKQNISIEMCLTSNVKGQMVPSYDKHHFQYWYKRGHPCVLCTDDKGRVLHGSLSGVPAGSLHLWFDSGGRVDALPAGHWIHLCPLANQTEAGEEVGGAQTADSPVRNDGCKTLPTVLPQWFVKHESTLLQLIISVSSISMHCINICTNTYMRCVKHLGLFKLN